MSLVTWGTMSEQRLYEEETHSRTIHPFKAISLMVMNVKERCSRGIQAHRLLLYHFFLGSWSAWIAESAWTCVAAPTAILRKLVQVRTAAESLTGLSVVYILIYTLRSRVASQVTQISRGTPETDRKIALMEFGSLRLHVFPIYPFKFQGCSKKEWSSKKTSE